MGFDPFLGLSEVRWIVEGDLGGQVVATHGTKSLQPGQLAKALEALKALSELGELVGFTQLETVTLRRNSVAQSLALRPGRFMLAEFDPGRGTARVDAALVRWRDEEQGFRLTVTPVPQQEAPAVDTGFSGRLSEFAVGDLLEFLRGGRRSGTLLLNSDTRAGVLRFFQGSVIGASPLVTPRRSRASGEIDAGHVEELVRSACPVTRAVEPALRQKVTSLLREFVACSSGDFVFTRDAQSPAVADLAQLDTRPVLFAVLQTIDDGDVTTVDISN